MNRTVEARQRVYGGAGAMARPAPSWLLVLLVLGLAAISHFVVDRYGLLALAIMLAVLITSFLMLHVSQRDYSVVIAIWFVTMSGFQVVGMIRMPGLPDFTFARLMLIWMILLLVIRYLVLGRRLHGPYLADALLLTYAVYLLIQSQVTNPTSFHLWYLCNLSPFVGFLAGKYLVDDERQVRNILIFFLLISIYYYITSIGEHFGLRALVWPKVILARDVGKWWEGRSRGPFLQAALFGQMIGMFVLVHFYLLTRSLRPALKVMLAISLALGLLGLFFTYTRGSWLGAVAGIATLAVLRPGYRKQVGILGVVLLVTGLAGMLQLADSEFLRYRVGGTNTLENRLGFLATAARMIVDHPFFGVGFFRYNAFSDIYNQGTYIPLYGYVKRGMSEGVVIHDIYLGRLAEEGLISGLLLTAFGLVIAWAFFKQWRAAPDGRWYNRDAMALFAAIIVSYLVGGTAIDYRYFDLVNVVPFFLAGIVYGAYRRRMAP